MAGCLRDKRLAPTAICCPRDLIEQLMRNAFAPGRAPRSNEYKEGVRAVLNQRFVGKPLACPHKAGTASFDAFFAGVDEGRSIWAEHAQETRAAA